MTYLRDNHGKIGPCYALPGEGRPGRPGRPGYGSAAARSRHPLWSSPPSNCHPGSEDLPTPAPRFPLPLSHATGARGRRAGRRLPATTAYPCSHCRTDTSLLCVGEDVIRGLPAIRRGIGGGPLPAAVIKRGVLATVTFVIHEALNMDRKILLVTLTLACVASCLARPKWGSSPPQGHLDVLSQAPLGPPHGSGSHGLTWTSDHEDMSGSSHGQISSGSNRGWNSGSSQGWSSGSNLGWNSGSNQGRNSGSNQGWNSGSNQGWNSGSSQGRNSGSNQGRNSGSNQGRNSGNNHGQISTGSHQGWDSDSDSDSNQGWNAASNRGQNRGSNQGWNSNSNQGHGQISTGSNQGWNSGSGSSVNSSPHHDDQVGSGSSGHHDNHAGGASTSRFPSHRREGQQQWEWDWDAVDATQHQQHLDDLLSEVLRRATQEGHQQHPGRGSGQQAGRAAAVPAHHHDVDEYGLPVVQH